MTGILLYEACYRLMTPEVVDGRIMFWVSLIGVGMNGVLMVRNRIYMYNENIYTVYMHIMNIPDGKGSSRYVY